MSRIEQALEKAAQLRYGSETGVAHRPVETFRQTPAETIGLEQVYEVPTEPVVNISNPLLVTVSDPSSPVAEEYRKLKSIVASKAKQNGFLNTIMVTSALGSEGKSVTALNLAISLAHECDHTVLLLDADLRKPSLSGYLGLDKGLPGLGDCLLDGMDPGGAIIKTGIGRLSFLPAGRRLERPAEMLASQKMRDLLTEMKHRYHDRYLILDTPPVLPVAETRSLASLVDGILFVVREGVPSPVEVRDACTALGDEKLLGLVYNHSETLLHSYRYQYQYGGYGQQDGFETRGKRSSAGFLGKLFGLRTQ